MGMMDDLRRRIDALLAGHPPDITDPHEFLGARFDAGLAFVSASPADGGMNADPACQPVVEAALAAAGAPEAFAYNPIGIGMTGPTLLVHGTAEQRAAYLRPLFTGAEVWSQLFSEPTAGSDLAGLSTRARRTGDHWVIDGQKVWTSWAHVARRGLLIARTDPGLPKHAGLTAFVVDMTTPGIEVRPLRQMTGEAEFNEVFFTEARIPDSDRLGEIGEGWQVSNTTLASERFELGRKGEAPSQAGRDILDAYRTAAARGHGNPVLRDQAVQLWIQARVNSLTAARAMEATHSPGPEGSILKLIMTEYGQRAADFKLDLAGLDGMIASDYRMAQPSLPYGNREPHPITTYLRTRAYTIEGGSSEIMRNILGERVLGLPGDVRVDKNIPWRDVRRSATADRS
jgi:alkylation response protein AidB-like acyl-CoA dehydrogenase